MKMVVFAHTPPPHHGQSYMVQLMLAGFGGDRRRGAQPATGDGSAGALGIECYHVNARLSRDLKDIGSTRWLKIFRLFGYCLQALWLRARYGAPTLYFVPAAPLRSSLYRDWFVMLLCRGWFRRTICHWHAVGMGDWLETHAKGWERRISHALMDKIELAVVLSKFNQADAERFRPRNVVVVPNGIPDPCPDYDTTAWPRRAFRSSLRRRLLAGERLEPPLPESADENPAHVKVLFMAHCTRDKGLFDAIEGVRLAGRQLAAQGTKLQFHLLVAGGLRTQAEQTEFEQLLALPDTGSWLRYAGFLAGEAKAAALREADVFCFPSYYASEGQPISLLEAMAFGLPIVTTRWRGIPELLPPGYPGLVEPRHPEQVAQGLLALLGETGWDLREIFLQHYTLAAHLAALAPAIRSVAGADEGLPIHGN